MPGFWDYLSQAAERYNQVRSDLEREQADLMNMYGNQLNNLYANTMSGLSLSSGLLGQKLGSLLNLYGTQTTAEEGAKNRASSYDIAKLNVGTNLAIAKLEADSAMDLAEKQAAYDRYAAYYQAQLDKALGKYGYFPNDYTNSAEAILNSGSGGRLPSNVGGSAPADNLGVYPSRVGTPPIKNSGNGYGQIPSTPNLSKQELNDIDKTIKKYDIRGNTIMVTDSEDFNKLNYYYERGVITFKPVLLDKNRLNPRYDVWRMP